MVTADLRIGIVGPAAEASGFADRLAPLPGVAWVGSEESDHAELIRRASPEALVILAPHPGHYRPAMDGLQAGCHVYLDRPFAAGVQEAVDVAGLAKGRGLVAAVGGHCRFLPSIVAARREIEAGAIGDVAFVSIVAPADRFDALVDALPWITGRAASEVSATEGGPGEVVCSGRLGDGIRMTLAVVDWEPRGFAMTFHADRGRLRADDEGLFLYRGPGAGAAVDLPEVGPGPVENFVAAITSGAELACPVADAVASTRLLEAISRSIATGQVVRLV